MFFALNFYCTQLRFVQLSNKAYDDEDHQLISLTGITSRVYTGWVMSQWRWG